MDRSVHPPVFGAEAVHSCAASVGVVPAGLVSMDRSVHPPVFRAEAVHSCAASVGVVLGVGIDGQECPSSCFRSGGGTLLCRVGRHCLGGWYRWRSVYSPIVPMLSHLAGSRISLLSLMYNGGRIKKNPAGRRLWGPPAMVG